MKSIGLLRYRIFAIALTLLILLQSFGWYAAWIGAWLHTRREAERQSIATEYWTVACADIAQYRIGKKEIRRNGQMFDILETKILGDSLRLALYADHREGKLVHAMHAFLQPARNAPSDSPIQIWWQSWRYSAFLLPDFPQLINPKATTVRQSFLRGNSRASSPFLPVAEQPPQALNGSKMCTTIHG